MPEFKDVTQEITKAVRDAAYVVVGLGVLGVGSDMPAELQQLFQLPDSAAEGLRMLYHRLGQTLIDREPELRHLRRRVFQIETSRSWKLANMLAEAASVLRRAGGRTKA